MHKWTWPARLAYALILVIIIGVTLVIPQVGAQDDDDDGICPYGQGFWRNTPQAWPVDQLTLGSQTYTQAELLALLDLPTTGDASLILAHQLIAAKLNVANGTNGEIILVTIAQMDALLATFEGRLPYDVAPSSSNGAAMVIAANTFDIFNQGVLSDDCEDDPEITPEASPEMTPESTLEATPEVTATPTPETTPGPEATPEATPDGVIIVIEGPVVEININIIVIYDINIVIAPDDPVLTVIQIGDILRVEGVLQDDDDGLVLIGDDDDDGATRITIVLVAINIVFVNIDVVIQDDVVWRDDGSCDNGPPPWAPAHGWRARCEQPQPGTIIIIDGDDDDDDGPGRGRGRGPRDDDDD
jgi:hypothetical protein